MPEGLDLSEKKQKRNTHFYAKSYWHNYYKIRIFLIIKGIIFFNIP